MKKILLFMAAAVLFGACEQYKEIKDVKPVENVSFSVDISLKKDDAIPAPKSYRVKLNNYAENIEQIKVVAAGESIQIDDVLPGIYTVSVSGESSVGDFRYVFNGNLSNIDVIDNSLKLSLEMSAARSGNIIFKEIFYCGSKIGGKTSYFRDQYYELYNNSDQVQYLDGLCIGNINPVNATANPYTWNRPNQEDYIYFESIWQVPYDKDNPENKLYPLQPGESVVLAQMAVNHQQERFNPQSPVDLSGAEFEFYLKTTANTFDNDAINMVAAFWKKSASIAQWMPTINGPAVAIFYPDETMLSMMYEEDYELKYASTWVVPVGSKSPMGKDMHIDCIVDAVELMLNETKITQKRMPAVLDAGAAWVGGTYISKSVSRRVKDTMEDGRVVYEDSNNSLEDFQVNDTPVLRRDGARTPSWNTWAK